MSLSATSPDVVWDVAEYCGAISTALLPGKGFGVVATRDLAAGELIHVGLPICAFDIKDFRGRKMIEVMRRARAWEWVQVRE